MAAVLSPSSSTTNFEPFQKSQLKSVQLANHVSEKTNIMAVLSNRYEQLFRSERHYDCIFHIGSAQVKCHKLILSSASPVFEAMFYGPIREESSDIEILDMSPEMFKVLVCYVYTGTANFEQFTLEEAIELYYGAAKYLLSELINDCLVAIKQKLRFANILPALELSVCMDLSGLLEICMSFFTHCCLSDTQFMAYHKSHYVHITKECIKAIIAVNKEMDKRLLWFVYEWCQQECTELGLQQTDYALIIDDLQLNAKGVNSDDLYDAKMKLQHCSLIERSYYKACRPFTVDDDANEWKLFVKSDRFISVLGIVMHSRLTPNLPAAAHLTQLAHAWNFPIEYSETLRIEITLHRPEQQHRQQLAALGGNSDGEESNPELDMEQEQQEQHDVPVWQYTVAKQMTYYNCDLNVDWCEGVTLVPGIEYQIKLIWQRDAYGAEYPCSLQSDVVDGIQFRDSCAHDGSLIKGLRFTNLI